MYKYIFTYSGVLITNEKQLGVKKQSTLHLTKKKKKKKDCIQASEFKMTTTF